MNLELDDVPGSQVDREHSAFFTPAWLAERVARWANVEAGALVLEPAAGRGALIRALNAVVTTAQHVWEIDVDNFRALSEIRPVPMMCSQGDFLHSPYVGVNFDLALMNPPYERNQDVRFVERALDCSKRVVGIFQSRIVHSKGRAEFWRWHNIDRLAILSERPRFGGEHSAKTDFVVMEVTRRGAARKQGEASPAMVEWWT